MDLTLPKSVGWSAAMLLDTNWGREVLPPPPPESKNVGRVGAVVKRVYVWSDDGAMPGIAIPIRQTDDMEGAVILAEAEMALFKANADWHFRGIGVGVANTPAALTAAEIRTGDTVRARFSRIAPTTPADTVNLFGFEPRGTRVPDADLPVPLPPVPFNFGKYGPNVFRATRRSEGYSLGTDTPALPSSMTITVETKVGVVSQTQLSKTMTLPGVTLRGWAYEGGPDKVAYWCSRASTQMVPDTLILSLTGAEVLWRATFPLTQMPLADLRRFSIEEAA